MVKVSCNNVFWEVYIGVSGQVGAPIGPSPLLKMNKSPTGDHYELVLSAYQEYTDMKNSCFNYSLIKLYTHTYE